MRKIQQGKALQVAGISITPVERLVIEGDCCPHGMAISVEYCPIGIIFDDGVRRWAIGVDGKPAEPDELTGE